MNPKIYKAFAARVKAGTAARTVDVVASTDCVDRQGDVLIQDWDLSSYEANPVVLYSHNMFYNCEPEDTLPIGFATDVRVEGGKLLATLNFVDEKASPMAELCYQGYLQGSLRAVSVGFRSKKGRMETIEGRDVYVLSGNELLEISACAMPANPEAVAEERAKSLDALNAIVKSSGGTTKEQTPRATANQETTTMSFAVIAAVLGLATTATEADVLGAVKSQSAASAANEQRARIIEKSVLEATGAKSFDEAIGVIAAGQEAVKQLAVVEKSAAEAKIEAEKTEKAALIAKGVAEHKLTPALKTWCETLPVATVKGFLASAPTIAALAGANTGDAKATDATEANAEVSVGDKKWEQLTAAEKHDLHFGNKAQYDALKADYTRRTGTKVGK